MKTLYLLRHATAAPGDDDLERPLDARGRNEAARAAALLAARAGFPEVALCSPARRARETLEPLKRARPGLPVSVDEGLYLASAGEILSRVQDLDRELRMALVVGHNPGIASLCSALTGVGSAFPPAFLAEVVLDAGDWADLAPGRCRLVELVRPTP